MTLYRLTLVGVVAGALASLALVWWSRRDLGQRPAPAATEAPSGASSEPPKLLGVFRAPFAIDRVPLRASGARPRSGYADDLRSLCTPGASGALDAASALAGEYGATAEHREAVLRALDEAIAQGDFDCALTLLVIARAVADPELSLRFVSATAFQLREVPGTGPFDSPDAMDSALRFLDALRVFVASHLGAEALVDACLRALEDLPRNFALLTLVFSAYPHLPPSALSSRLAALMRSYVGDVFLDSLRMIGASGHGDRIDERSLESLLRSPSLRREALRFLTARGMSVMDPRRAVDLLVRSHPDEGGFRLSVQDVLGVTSDLAQQAESDARAFALVEDVAYRMRATETSVQRALLSAVAFSLARRHSTSSASHEVGRYLEEVPAQPEDVVDAVARANLFAVVAARADRGELLKWLQRSSERDDAGVTAQCLALLTYPRAGEVVEGGHARGTVVAVAQRELGRAPAPSRVNLLSNHFELIEAWRLVEVSSETARLAERLPPELRGQGRRAAAALDAMR